MILQSFEMQALLVEIGLMITIIEAKAEILSFFKSKKNMYNLLFMLYKSEHYSSKFVKHSVMPYRHLKL